MPDGESLLPANLPAVEHARLPAIYESAKAALAECSRMDECKEWANKADAMASYARQAADDTFFAYARRIKARAIQRCGELLAEIPPARGANQNIRDGADPKVTRESASAEVGISERQRKTMLRVNNVPNEQFEALVESENPPSIEQLAEIGTQKRPEPVIIDHLQGRDPEDFAQATQLIGMLRFLKEKKVALDVEAANRGLRDLERELARVNLAEAMDWLAGVEEVLNNGV